MCPAQSVKFGEYLYFNDTGNEASKLFFEEFLSTLQETV